MDRDQQRSREHGFQDLALKAQQRFPILSHGLQRSTELQTAASTPNEEQAGMVLLDLSTLNGLNVSPKVVETQVDLTILLYATISYMTRYEYRPKEFFNHTFWLPSSSSKAHLAAMDRTDWAADPPELTPQVCLGKTLDLVINNLDDRGHPLHLHGHDFFVIARHQPSRMGAFEQYNPFDGDSKPNGVSLKSPVMKDTVYAPSMEYVVLRLQVDNPGLWLLHCHVLWHGEVGMNMALDVADMPG